MPSSDTAAGTLFADLFCRAARVGSVGTANFSTILDHRNELMGPRSGGLPVMSCSAKVNFAGFSRTTASELRCIKPSFFAGHAAMANLPFPVMPFAGCSLSALRRLTLIINPRANIAFWSYSDLPKTFPIV
ncbi:hypothetical protein [Bradyrhizobium sp. WSM1417]|uniref:hypothetical protein n=1 Tax=Bradyrhizobium sp. WSM1417 TaxID=754500 RepID=UPI0012EC297C|nr:hypothetical protein [Bradyrhizobium sp. WSM1417]